MVGQSVPKRIQKLLHVHMNHSLSIWNIRLNFWEIVQLEMRLMMCWWMSRFQYKGNLILRKVKRLKLVMKRYVLQLGRLMNIVPGEPLMQRKDDTAAVLKSRLEAFHRQTEPLSVKHVMREQNILAANEFIELFCEFIVQRLTIIAKQRECPADLKERISSLIFAAPRCSEIPELVALTDVFEKNYGKDFVGAATDLRPSCGEIEWVSNKVVELGKNSPLVVSSFNAYVTGEMETASKVAVSQWLGSDYLVPWKCQTEQLRKPSQVKSGQPGSVHLLSYKHRLLL
ncbi:putative adenylate kinase [Helianthus annuus]|uniref:Adenylate kinase n=1 Tax=Helianthus annuus TaxID=4232 RepID=A0A9K3H7X2_HELAN|nr:putative adenylate kinase [Helianthus annuus]